MGRCEVIKPNEIYACLIATEFPVQALLRLRPELHNRPCVVMEGEPPTQQVASLNTKARTLGIVPGMTQVEVDTFPAITVLRRSIGEEIAAAAILLECADSFSPRVENQARDRTFLCVMDVARTESMFGPPEALVTNFLTRVKSLGILACVAVSHNFHTAIAVAKALSLQTATRVISAGEESTILAPLSLTVLDLNVEQMETFSLWGVRTLGGLAALPEKELIARMGQAGKHLRQLARGEAAHLFQPQEPVFLLEERMELDTPVELINALLFVVNVMLEQLILRATARVLALASITIRLMLEGGITHTRTVQPALPTNDKQLWIKLLHLDLEAHSPQAAILAVEIKAESGSTSKLQLGLFSPQLPEPLRLDVTLARIRAIVGENNVGRAVLTDTHQTDGFRMEPFSIPNTQPTEGIPDSLRPAMKMLRPAETTFVTSQSSRPKAFIFRQHRYSVERAYGPWLTSGEWWASTLWGCEQWDLVARSQEGNVLCCCLVRNRLQDDWRMVALYD